MRGLVVADSLPSGLAMAEGVDSVSMRNRQDVYIGGGQGVAGLLERLDSGFRIHIETCGKSGSNNGA